MSKKTGWFSSEPKTDFKLFNFENEFNDLMIVISESMNGKEVYNVAYQKNKTKKKQANVWLISGNVYYIM